MSICLPTYKYTKKWVKYTQIHRTSFEKLNRHRKNKSNAAGTTNGEKFEKFAILFLGFAISFSGMQNFVERGMGKCRPTVRALNCEVVRLF